VTIIYISHRLDEVFEIADQVTVVRDGHVVGTRAVAEIDKGTLIRMMVGRTLDETFPPSQGGIGAPLLKVEGLTSARLGLRDISFTLHRGEILGIAGLVGAGRSELAMALFGVAPADSGQVWFNNQPVRLGNPKRSMALGIALVPENRKEQGLVLSQSVRNNASLAIIDRLRGLMLIDERREREIIEKQIQDMAIKTPSLEQQVCYLSGGNQQKVVLAKWLCAEPKLIILDEPTRGIDVGTKAEIYLLMRQLADRGAAIMMISSELPEVIGMSDRILVMSRGRLAGELRRTEATEERILTLAIGDTLAAPCEPA
jgi:ribose transport system ATP-binding protein